MCGIVGIRRFAGPPVKASLLREMAQTLHHRGPDDGGTWVDGSMGVGHRRLSIIDLGGSTQPMVSADGRHVLVFNGEIYNYQELRARLDYPFRTHGDTEVLLAGLIAHGEGFLDQVRGQFAFGLVHTIDGSVLLGRDPAGILPLYYHHDQHGLAFASEIKALLPALGEAQVDEASLDAYLARGAVPAPHTLFANVRKVLPGHVAHLDADGTLRIRRYAALPGRDEKLRLSPTEAVDAVHDRLKAAVAATQVADVPVGAYLSGGLDSSLITALMRQDQPKGRIETFSAGFGDPRFDELPYAKRVSDLMRTNHHVVEVRPDDFGSLWPRLTWHRDGPLSQPADIAVYRLAELARSHVKVALSGEGSDELFAGYNKYRYLRAAEVAAVAPGGAWLAGKLAPRSPRNVRIVLNAVASPDAQSRRESWFAPFGPDSRRDLLLAPAESRPLPWALDGGQVDRQLAHDFHTWLPDNLLERGDRMSMAASLEMRPPFLHRDVVDLAFRLPASVKVRWGTPKWVVRQVATRYLPSEIIDRPKVGFRVPLDAWFRGGLRGMSRDLLLASDSFASSVFDRRQVTELLDRHDGGGSEESRIWTLLALEVWHREFFPR